MNLLKLPIYTTDRAFLALLRRQRGLIATGLKHLFTEHAGRVVCSWGCEDEQAHAAGLACHTHAHQRCPLESEKDAADLRGCYHRCRVWQGTGGESTVTRDECLRLYDVRIREFETICGPGCGTLEHAI